MLSECGELMMFLLFLSIYFRFHSLCILFSIILSLSLSFSLSFFCFCSPLSMYLFLFFFILSLFPLQVVWLFSISITVQLYSCWRCCSCFCVILFFLCMYSSFSNNKIPSNFEARPHETCCNCCNINIKWEQKRWQ